MSGRLGVRELEQNEGHAWALIAARAGSVTTLVFVELHCSWELFWPLVLLFGLLDRSLFVYLLLLRNAV